MGFEEFGPFFDPFDDPYDDCDDIVPGRDRANGFDPFAPIRDNVEDIELVDINDVAN